jgi:hypothetical protein
MIPILAPVLSSVLSSVGSILERAISDTNARAQAQVELAKMALDGDLAQAQREFELLKAQADINLEDSKSGKQGWRFYAGWVCVAGFSWNVLLYPILYSVLGAMGVEVPNIKTDEILYPLLTAMLGLGGIKSIDLWTGGRK